MDEKPPVNKRTQRRDNRAAAMQFLYQWEMNRPEILSDAICQFFSVREQPREFFAFAEELVNGLIAKMEGVDSEIRELTQNWRFERIAKVDLAILRLAIYEIRFRLDIPPIVSIDEAIELSKVYSSPDSKRFINGILDEMKNRITRPLRTAAV